MNISPSDYTIIQLQNQTQLSDNYTTSLTKMGWIVK
jgi:hypothetical protein